MGHTLFQDEKESYLLYVYSRTVSNTWMLKKKRELDENLRHVCVQFEFKNRSPNELILTTCHQIMLFNYETDELKPIHIFLNYLNSQPIYSVFNQQQTTVVVATFYDVLFVDLK